MCVWHHPTNDFNFHGEGYGQFIRAVSNVGQINIKFGQQLSNEIFGVHTTSKTLLSSY